MWKTSILFVVSFTALLIYAKSKESLHTQSSIQQRPKSPKQIQIQTKKEKLKTKVVRMLVTAYCPCKICCGKFADGKTPKGKDAWRTDGVATDLQLLPHETKLVIPGIGIRVVDDTGGAMRKSAKKGNYHIDVRFRLPDGVEKTPEEMKKCHQRALEFGKKWHNVTILSPTN